ncbi:MAG: substrate-binding domain-containing protein [Thermoproteota archaeon]|nr:substrate-binding domain-containing protein [Thermoproteota archaeon]
MKHKKIALVSLSVIVSVATMIILIIALASYFQARPDHPTRSDQAENIQESTNGKISNESVAIPKTATTLDVVSTTSAFPFLQRWIAQYQDRQPASTGDVNVEYLADREINSADRDSARSHLAIVGTANENDNNNDTLYIPVSAQAVAIVYNVPSFPDIPSGLRLNSTTLFYILNGNITQWDDAAIKQLNPSLNLPGQRIVVVHSTEDDASNNNNFYSSENVSSSQMLLRQYLGFRSYIWPQNDSITASGPAELAEMVRKIPYSIGYVDFSYAVQTRMTYAALENTQGDYILPSTQSIDKAVDIALQFHNPSGERLSTLQQQQLPPTINASRIVNDSYPIVGLYYASVSANNEYDDRYEEEGKRISAAILDFIEWITSEDGGQQTLLEVQYPPIYSGNEQLITYAKATIDRIQNFSSNQ